MGRRQGVRRLVFEADRDAATARSVVLRRRCETSKRPRWNGVDGTDGSDGRAAYVCCDELNDEDDSVLCCAFL